MWRINGHSAILWKGHRVFEVFARFSATSYLSDVFILEMAKAHVEIFHHSETVSCSHTRKVIVPPVLFAITKGYALVTAVAPLGSTPSLAKSVMRCNNLSKEPFWWYSSGHRCRNCIQDQGCMGPQEGWARSPLNLYLLILYILSKSQFRDIIDQVFDETISNLVSCLSLHLTSVKMRL